MGRKLNDKLRIAILSHEFLINIGANDFLKNILRGLSFRNNELIFLSPKSNEKIEHITSENTKNRLRKIPFFKYLSRYIMRHVGSATDIIIKHNNKDYDYYLEACPSMRIIPCENNPDSLQKIRIDEKIDIFLPSIHCLPESLPYVTYWPDCQPKHYPEFFDDAAQRVRDGMIKKLLTSGKPMIINSKNAKSDMVRFYSANPDQIFDLPFAPIIEFQKLIPRPELLNKYNLNRKYFLVSNQFWIHKSLETAIKAAWLIKNKDLNVDIVFTGKMEEPRKPKYINQLMQMVEEFDLKHNVKMLGYIPKDDQIEIMKGAIAVIQPTLFEGGPGGGSVYDAISLGIRVIASDIEINKELPVNDDSVLLFEKENPHDLVKKMVFMMNDLYQYPSIEDLYQQSKKATERLSNRLYEVIDYELSR